MMLSADVLLGFLLPPTKTMEGIVLNPNPHSERTLQHKLPNKKIGNQQMPNVGFHAAFTFSVSMIQS